MTKHKKAARGPRPGSFHKLLRKAREAHALSVRLRDMALPAFGGFLTPGVL